MSATGCIQYSGSQAARDQDRIVVDKAKPDMSWLRYFRIYFFALSKTVAWHLGQGGMRPIRLN